MTLDDENDGVDRTKRAACELYDEDLLGEEREEMRAFNEWFDDSEWSNGFDFERFVRRNRETGGGTEGDE